MHLFIYIFRVLSKDECCSAHLQMGSTKQHHLERGWICPLSYQVILPKENGAKRATEFASCERDWLTVCNKICLENIRKKLKQLSLFEADFSNSLVESLTISVWNIMSTRGCGMFCLIQNSIKLHFTYTSLNPPSRSFEPLCWKIMAPVSPQKFCS